ncbi:MAG: DUF4129 domain-containing transglutaminase family protein [Tepidiformaceae bacterium]
MAGVNVRANPSSRRRFGEKAASAPLLVMSWEDWLTFAAALVTFVSIAISIQQAHWVADMPPLVLTAMAGLLIGMLAARIHRKAAAIHPIALVLGVVVVLLVVQTYADGSNVVERLGDFRTRMREWVDVIRAGDISNDNLPFVTLVHGVCFLCAYLASWSLFRWRNAWLAIIPGGIVLLSNIAFLEGRPSATFIIFLFGAIVLIARMHLQRSEVKWRKLGVEYPEFLSLSAMQLTLVSTLALILMAWSLPLGGQAGPAQGLFDWLATPATSHTDTLVRLFHNVDSRKGAKLHSLGDILAIQSNITLSSTPVFQVTSSAPGLVRAQSYEVYTGNGWKISGRDTEKVPAQQAAPDQAATNYKARQQESLTVKLLDAEDTLLTPGTPLGANVATTIETPRSFTGDIERMQAQGSLGTNDTYNTVGSVSIATAEQLEGAGTNYPSYVAQRYLQLPKIPQRVTDEAKRVAATGGGDTAYQRAKAIEQYLQTFPFDLNVTAPPPGRDMTDYFLFDLKRGYFDYQATAMAVMLRSIGIPARVAVGYVLDSTQAKGNVYTVSKDDAYSWVEVFFPQFGWVNFNPTSGKFGGSGIPGAAGPAGSGIIDPSLLPGGIIGPNINDVDPNPTADRALAQPATVHGDPPWTLIWTLAGIAALVVAGAVALRLSWTWGMSGLSGRPRLWAQTQRVAGWAGLGSEVWETPREWSQRLGGALDQEDDAAKFAAAYEESRYGRKDVQSIDESEVTTAYRKLRARLLRAIPKRGRKEKPVRDEFWSKKR